MGVRAAHGDGRLCVHYSPRPVSLAGVTCSSAPCRCRPAHRRCLMPGTGPWPTVKQSSPSTVHHPGRAGGGPGIPHSVDAALSVLFHPVDVCVITRQRLLPAEVSTGNLVNGSSLSHSCFFCHLLNKTTSQDICRMAPCANRVPVEAAASGMVSFGGFTSPPV